MITILAYTNVLGQVSRLTSVCKKDLTYHYPTKDGFIDNKCLKKDKKDYWIVFSDREENVSYKDPYAQYPLKKVGFMHPCFVVNEKNDFLELVTYQSDLLPPRDGMVASILKKEKRFRFEDIKSVEYVGWIHKSRLLLNSDAWVVPTNMKPARYILDIGDPSVLIKIEKLIKEDTIRTFKNPELTKEIIPEALVANLKDLVYVYKESDDKEKVLIGYDPSFNPDDLSRVCGWIDRDIVLDVGQQQILRFMDAETPITSENIEEYPFYFNGMHQLEELAPSNQNKFVTRESIKIWDHSPNKVINISGDYVYLNQFEDLKANSKKLNIMLLVESHPMMQTELLQLTNSLQKLHMICNKEEFQGYSHSLGAVAYDGSSVKQALPLGTEFPQWLDFVKKVADEATGYSYQDTVQNGLDRAFEEATKMLRAKKEETNLIIIVGANANTYNEQRNAILANTIGEVSPRLFFYQLQHREGDSYLNFVFKAKSLLYTVGRISAKKIQNYIVDSKLYKPEFPFNIVDESKNIYLFDTERCMYQGGVAFPKMNKVLHPNTFDQLFEQLLLQTATHNTQIESSLQAYFDGVGKTRSQTNPELLDTLDEKTLVDNDITDLSEKSYGKNYQIPIIGESDEDSLELKHYYLLSPQEHESCVNHLKKLTPIPPVTMTKKFRRKLHKSYKRSFKHLNGIFCEKTRMHKEALSKLMFMGTGIAVNEKKYKDTNLKYIKRQGKLPNDVLKKLLLDLRDTIKELEEYPIINQEDIYEVQGIKYICIPEELMP